jgi:uncharacterized protein (DUF1697 family)
MAIFIALIRAIGPATHALMSMRDLRERCAAAGLEDVATYIQTGNIIIKTRRSPANVQAIVEKVLKSFGLANLVVLREVGELAAILADNPFPEGAIARPDQLAVCFMSGDPGDDGLARLGGHKGPERVKPIGRNICIDYVNGIQGSKLMPAVVERWLGMQGTARNWNTLRKLVALAQA